MGDFTNYKRARLKKGGVVHTVDNTAKTWAIILLSTLCDDGKGHWHREPTVIYTTDPVTCKKCLRELKK